MYASDLKVLINKQQTKVLFVEASNDFVDYLLSFLTFPLGRVGDYIADKTPIGSIDTLKSGLSNLNNSYFCAADVKGMLLNPASPFQEEYVKLILDINFTWWNYAVFICKDSNCKESQHRDVSLYDDCGKPLTRSEGCRQGGVFAVKPSSFIITDDLLVAPIGNGILQTLEKFGITDIEGAHLMLFTLNNVDVRTLFKFSLFSATPLNDLILNKSRLTMAKPEPRIFRHHVDKGGAGSRKKVLKVVLQKSTNEFLFAEADHEFVEFLFSLLAIPLGEVVSLLGGNTCFKGIDNLYRSVTDLIDNEYFLDPNIKSRFVHRITHQNSGKHVTSFHTGTGRRIYSFKTIKEGFLKKPSTFFLDDDLTVTPSFTTSILALSDRGIPLRDLKEMEFHIGFEEALRILSVSLTSKTVLTDALIKPTLRNKQIKQEDFSLPWK